MQYPLDHMVRTLEIDNFMDCLDSIPNDITLPDDLNLTELILKTKAIWSISYVDKLVPIVHQTASKEADDQ